MGGQLDVYMMLRAKIESRLAELVELDGPLDPLQGSLRHSLLAPAKRVRAVLTLVAARELGGRETDALDLACAVEMIHTSSLILDDLPCMDNAATRRGIPSNHRVFGEATAILASIGLMNRAYGVAAAAAKLSADQRAEAVGVLEWSVGLEGLVRGQHDDLADYRATMNEAQLETMYAQKTGALFAAAAECGAIVANNQAARPAMRKFGLDLGVGFQILDDVLDAHATSDRAGKDTSKDSGRTTFPSLLGVTEAAEIGRAKIEGGVGAAVAAAQAAGSDGRLFTAFASRLAEAFSELMPEFQGKLVVSA
ncbi:polyprenyl synthetase family protein [Rhodomicrobium lacus]|uniref:polyprenyl synthetase family protein n=1 Tax=Rhodomicrobium lacus TaxID=2498452 RepID=UPI000F8E71FD|nr:polyprenyl synthetase family protein [Rhodomicrobium lacus]